MWMDARRQDIQFAFACVGLYGVSSPSAPLLNRCQTSARYSNRRASSGPTLAARLAGR